MAHSCSEKTPSPFSFHAKSMASQSPFARQLPPLTCFLITSKCCSRITPRFLKSESLPSSLNVSRGNDIPFRENAACASSVQCTYVCNVVYCCTVCCTSTAVLLYGASPPPNVLIVAATAFLDAVLICTRSLQLNWWVLVLIGTSELSTCSYGHVLIIIIF